MYANNTTFIGLDVHKKSIVGAMLTPDTRKPEQLGKIINEPNAVKRLVKKLKKRAPGPMVTCCEAGPCGYDLQRQLTSLGLECMVVAPSLIPRKPGERIKTDKRDAKKLTEYLRSGLLTEVAESHPYAERVGWLRCFRGIDTVVAITLLAELHDFRRFTCPRELMSYLGLTPSEHSSDEKKRRGGITKTGNSHV